VKIQWKEVKIVIKSKKKNKAKLRVVGAAGEVVEQGSEGESKQND
jgi:hypothetical protein